MPDTFVPPEDRDDWPPRSLTEPVPPPPYSPESDEPAPADVERPAEVARFGAAVLAAVIVGALGMFAAASLLIVAAARDLGTNADLRASWIVMAGLAMTFCGARLRLTEHDDPPSLHIELAAWPHNAGIRAIAAITIVPLVLLGLWMALQSLNASTGTAAYVLGGLLVTQLLPVVANWWGRRRWPGQSLRVRRALGGGAWESR